MSSLNGQNKVECWDVFELSVSGPKTGNPFMDVTLLGQFKLGHRMVEVEGFYDGEGLYKIRFMPDHQGIWKFTTICNVEDLNGRTGEFECTAPSDGNHGPVRVRDMYHFSYEDGTPYLPFGTTCYVWNHQGDSLEEQTLKTLAESPFNKMRMCVFPKHYDYNHNEPEYHAFEGSLEKGWDYTKLNPAFFRHLEKRIGHLKDLGIEADLIIFHPYDKWGYAKMDSKTDERYLRYLIARLGAYRNIWWSLANEYDLMKEKTMTDWDQIFRIIQQYDPYQHLRSIHNCWAFYDHGKPWVTHCSIQHGDMSQVSKWRDQYRKPMVLDEVCYEGNINHGWGNISGNELVHRFWEGNIRGGYVGHGETYMHPQDILWWSKGGKLHGLSPLRIGFLKKIMQEAPVQGLVPVDMRGDVVTGGKEGEYYLMYLGIRQPSFRIIELPADRKFRIEIIDTWEMTITPVTGEFSGKCRVELPGKQYMALRIQRIKDGE